MKTKTEQQKWDILFKMIPNILNGKTFALAKRNKEYSERYNFMTYNEMKAYLIGMQELIRINNLNK